MKIYVNSINDLFDEVFAMDKVKPTENHFKTRNVTVCVYDKLNKVYRLGVV